MLDIVFINLLAYNCHKIKLNLQGKMFTLSNICSISSLLTRLGCNNTVVSIFESFLVFVIFFKIFPSKRNNNKTNISG